MRQAEARGCEHRGRFWGALAVLIVRFTLRLVARPRLCKKPPPQMEDRAGALPTSFISKSAHGGHYPEWTLTGRGRVPCRLMHGEPSCSRSLRTRMIAFRRRRHVCPTVTVGGKVDEGQAGQIGIDDAMSDIRRSQRRFLVHAATSLSPQIPLSCSRPDFLLDSIRTCGQAFFNDCAFKALDQNGKKIPGGCDNPLGCLSTAEPRMGPDFAGPS